MKLNVKVDCTPEEARRFLGLPDLTPVHEKYIANMLETLEKGISPDTFEAMIKSWAPMGEAGMRLWQQMFERPGGADR